MRIKLREVVSVFQSRPEETDGYFCSPPSHYQQQQQQFPALLRPATQPSQQQVSQAGHYPGLPPGLPPGHYCGPQHQQKFHHHNSLQNIQQFPGSKQKEETQKGPVLPLKRRKLKLIKLKLEKYFLKKIFNSSYSRFTID